MTKYLVIETEYSQTKLQPHHNHTTTTPQPQPHQANTTNINNNATPTTTKKHVNRYKILRRALSRRFEPKWFLLHGEPRCGIHKTKFGHSLLTKLARTLDGTQAQKQAMQEQKVPMQDEKQPRVRMLGLWRRFPDN